MAEVPSAEVALVLDGLVEEDFSEVSNEAWGLFGPPFIPS
jgi:hypothetical protein